MKLQFIASLAFLLLSAVPAVAAEVSSSFIISFIVIVSSWYCICVLYRLLYSLALIYVHNHHRQYSNTPFLLSPIFLSCLLYQLSTLYPLSHHLPMSSPRTSAASSWHLLPTLKTLTRRMLTCLLMKIALNKNNNSIRMMVPRGSIKSQVLGAFNLPITLSHPALVPLGNAGASVHPPIASAKGVVTAPQIITASIPLLVR